MGRWYKKIIAAFLCICVSLMASHADTINAAGERVNLVIKPGNWIPQTYNITGPGTYEITCGYSTQNGTGTWQGLTTFENLVPIGYASQIYNNIITDQYAATALTRMQFQQPFNIQYSSDITADFTISVFFKEMKIYANRQDTYNQTWYIETLSDCGNGGIFNEKFTAGTNSQTANRSMALTDHVFMNIQDAGGNFAAFYYNRYMLFTPVLEFVVTSNSETLDLRITLEQPTYTFYPQYAYRDSSLPANIYTYMLFTKAFTIPDSRKLIALKNIWSAINGSSTSTNLVDEIRNQTNSLEEGFDNSQGNAYVEGLNDEVTDYINAESQTSEAFSEMSRADFGEYLDFDQEFETEAFGIYSSATESIFARLKFVRNLVIVTLVTLAIAIITGMRRFF